MRVVKFWGHYIDLDHVLSIGPMYEVATTVTFDAEYRAWRSEVKIQFVLREQPVAYRCRDNRPRKSIPAVERMEYDQLINDWMNKPAITTKYKET